ncbi:NAD(P)H-binding protein [Chitinophaga barathri]|uniref:NAD-dependent dehydratase n=1 Tax=Chitinophaga barathri TaxID=1647451 RepID=A0A3N4MDD5_9BACT|nr:NAD(P)H-binding protein [Chitinophaga barathri]RPD38090.1 NAD-dependent dehydratase [Chitinophaga barathri]
MHITLTGSIGNISGRIAEILIGQGHNVTLISHQPERAAQIEAIKAWPAIGSLEDSAFLHRAFSGADAIYTMIPPNPGAADYNTFVRNVQNSYAEAIRSGGVKYVVNLSSAASPLAGSAPLEGFQNMEDHLNHLPDTNILHLRPGLFYTNLYGSIDLIRHQCIIGNNFAASTAMVMSHPQDIAEAAADALQTRAFRGKEVLYISSDRKTGKEIAGILGEAVDRPELQWVQFPDEQLLEALTARGLSRDIAQHYLIDMGIAIREGVLDKHYSRYAQKVWGKRGLESFANEFAQAYSRQ